MIRRRQRRRAQGAARPKDAKTARKAPNKSASMKTAAQPAPKHQPSGQHPGASRKHGGPGRR